MKTFIVLVLFYLITICQSVPVFLEEDRSFDIDDPTEPSNTVKELVNIYYFWKDPHFIYVSLNAHSYTGCKSIFRKIFEFKNRKEPMLLLN